MPRDAEGLNPRQGRFVGEYLKDFNGTQALVRAGYSPKGANRQVSAMLSNPVIAHAIARRRGAFMATLESKSVASLREIQVDLTTQLRGARFEQDIADLDDKVADMEAAAAILRRDLRRRGVDPATHAQTAVQLLAVDRRIFKHMVRIARLRIDQGRVARRAAELLAKMFGAFDPWRPPVKTMEEATSRFMYDLRRARGAGFETLGK